jgi:succinate-semialdehyde dehydrogenase
MAMATPRQAEQAIAAAADAFPGWRTKLGNDRGACLQRWADLMRRHLEDLAVIMTCKQGKPLAESRGEIDYAASFLDWFAAEGQRLEGEVLQPHRADRRMIVVREPIGVVAAITPWNFPSAMITRKAGAALAAGCTMVLLPSCETPLSALALAVLAEEAGLPPGVFNVVVGDGAELGKVLATSATVRSLSFTVSTAVGRILQRQCADTVKRVSLELGGDAPFLVFADADADLDRAVADAVTAKFQTSGQDCLAANRLLVEAPIYDAFCDRFARAVEALGVGPGFSPNVEIGPLINPRAVEKCRAQVADALEKGARLVLRGGSVDLGPCYFAPTVMADVTPDMRNFSEETFGHVAAITPFSDEGEAVALANASDYGLAAYLYTSDAKRIWRVGDALEYGMVGINTPSFAGPPITFGGMKQSGLGREAGAYSFADYTETKYLCMGLT